MPKKYYMEQDGVTQALDLRDIDPSPYQHRKNFDSDKLIETIVEIVDVELIEDPEYASMEKTPADRIKTFLGQLGSVRSSQSRGSEVSNRSKALFHKFVEQVEGIFKNMSNPMKWLSFYLNNLPLLVDICIEVQDVLIIFDPPYFKKQSKNYDPGSISGLSKEKYRELAAAEGKLQLKV